MLLFYIDESGHHRMAPDEHHPDRLARDTTDWFVLSVVLGRPDVRLYDGSMVEWTANPNRPVASSRTRLDDLKKTLGLGS